MRPDTYKALTVKEKRWVFGRLVSDNKIIDKEPNPSPLLHGYCDVEDNRTYEVIPGTVCMSTGITDRNKRELYEGDIIGAYLDEVFPEERITLLIVWHDYGFFGLDSEGNFTALEKQWVQDNFEFLKSWHEL